MHACVRVCACLIASDGQKRGLKEIERMLEVTRVQSILSSSPFCWMCSSLLLWSSSSWVRVVLPRLLFGLRASIQATGLEIAHWCSVSDVIFVCLSF